MRSDDPAFSIGSLVVMATISLSFVFAMEKVVYRDLATSQTVLQLKEWLVEHWPASEPAAPSPSNLRLIAMGQMMADDSKTIGGKIMMCLDVPSLTSFLYHF